MPKPESKGEKEEEKHGGWEYVANSEQKHIQSEKDLSSNELPNLILAPCRAVLLGCAHPSHIPARTGTLDTLRGITDALRPPGP